MSEQRNLDGRNIFRSSPPLFRQVYTIHALLNGQFFPLVIALLPDKQELTYRRLLIQLQLEAVNRGHAFAPQRVHCDFEMAVMQAVRAELGVEPTGCLFHFDQSVYRHVQTLGMQVAYNTDTPQRYIRRWVRS